MMIDAHQHYWEIARGDYGWLTPARGAIYRDFGPEDLKPLLKAHRISSTILVQCAQTVAETEYLLGIAAHTPSVAGVVGWVDFEAEDALETLARLAKNPLLVGVRPMMQGLPDDDWMLRPGHHKVFRALVEHGLVFDALVFPRHLPRLLTLIDRHPDLAVVVDHIAKPGIAKGALDPWRADMAAIAARPHVFCKLSGLVTEAAKGWKLADLRPYAAHVLKVFGPKRLVWGSDWPVVNQNGGYDAWRAASLKLIARCTPAEQKAILGGNAKRLYLGKRGRR